MWPCPRELGVDVDESQETQQVYKYIYCFKVDAYLLGSGGRDIQKETSGMSIGQIEQLMELQFGYSV